MPEIETPVAPAPVAEPVAPVQEPTVTPSSEPAKPAEPTNEPTKEPSSSAQPTGNGQVDNPLFSAYQQFDALLEENPELTQEIERAVQTFAQKKKGGANAQQNAQNNQPNQGGQGSQNSEVTALRDEIRLKDYLSEFTRLAQSANIPQEALQDAFEGTVAEVLKFEANPLGNFNLAHAKKGFESWVAKQERINKSFNSRYAAQKEKDNVPPSGAGAAPIKQQPELTDPQGRRDYIANGLRAAFNT